MGTEMRQARWLWLILLLGLALRLAFAMSLPTLPAFSSAGGGDSGWYLAIGAGFFSGDEHGYANGLSFYNSAIPLPPLYILFTGIFQIFLPPHATIVVIRVLQCLAATATVYLACRIGAVVTRDQRVGLAIAALASFHPALITEPANIATETLYIFFVIAGLWLYVAVFLERSLEAASFPTGSATLPWQWRRWYSAWRH